MLRISKLLIVIALGTGLMACESESSNSEPLNDFVFASDGKSDSLFPAPAACSYEEPWRADAANDLEDFVDRTRVYTASSRLLETQARQIYLAGIHLGMLDGDEDFDAVWEASDDEDYTIKRLEFEDGERFDWLKFYAGDTQIGVVFRYNTLDIVAEISDGDILSCTSTDPGSAAPSPNLDATLYIQTSAEYRATSKMTYKMASLQLDAAIADTSWVAATEQTSGYEQKPPAIILDLDETVIDNSPFQARLIMDNVLYHSSRWSKWANESNAGPVPGAVEFIREAHAKGVTIFYVSNRSASLEESTRINLEKLDLPLETFDTVLLKREEAGWESDKTPRRERVAETHRIIMLFGDNLGDFVSGAKSSVEDRNALEAANDDKWGTFWFMLPNPMYGYWEGALYNHEYVGDEVKQLIKKESLDTKR